MTTKISALPAATAPLSADVVPIVQSGVTKKITAPALLGFSTPEMSGAVGNGSTSDSTPFATANAAVKALRLSANTTYQITANLNFGSNSVFGSKGTTIRGKGISFNPGADFYDTQVTHLIVDGTGSGGAETGVKVTKGHRTLLNSVVATTGFLQGAWFTGSYLTTLLNCRIVLNSFGTLVEENSNGWTAIASSFGGTPGTKPDYGVTMRGSYSCTSFACDYEYNNSNGLVFSNYVGTGAEPRVNRSIGDYFEGNSGNDIWIGDQVPTSGNYARGCIVWGGYYQGGAGTVNGIRVEYSDSAKIMWNYMPQAYSNTKIFLKSVSRNTTIVPFPRQDLAVASEISVEAGATVSDQTIQYGRATVTTDGSGNGFVDITFTAGYDSSTGIPPIFCQLYATTDVTTGGVVRANSVTVTGFRLRVIGAAISTTVTVFWRAGA